MVQEMNLDIATTKISRNSEFVFLRSALKLGWAVLIICGIIQIFFFVSLVNLLAIGAVILGWLILSKVFLTPSMLTTYPLSTFVITAFVAGQLYLPLIFTTLEGKSLVNNLELPEQVFLHSIAQLAVLTLFHKFYRQLSRTSGGTSFSLLGKLGFFTPPTHLQMWAMGFVGIGATFYIYFTGTDTGWQVTGSPIEKLIQALMPFSYAPFFIPFGELYGNKQKLSKKIIFYLLMYAVLLFAVSIGRNSRGAFMFGFTSVGFGYILGLLLGVYKSKFFTLKNIFFAGILFWLLIGPIADLGTAMVIVRGERQEQDLTGAELIDRTLETYWDKDAIVARRLEDSDVPWEPDWDERYLDNIFIARFANIKFNDLSLIQFNKLGEVDPDMMNYSIDFLLSQLPEPVLQRFGLDVDKEAVLTFSFGDYLYLLAGGNGVPQGYRTGHLAGTGMATFDWWYLLILGVGMIPVFWLLDKFFMRKTLKPEESPNRINYQFSFCGMLYLTDIYQFLPPESVVNIGVFLMRGYIQLVVLYFVVFHLTRFVAGSRKLRWR